MKDIDQQDILNTAANQDLAEAMIGALVGYDALPYQLATTDHDRLEKRYVDDHSYYKLDERAALDFVSYWNMRREMESIEIFQDDILHTAADLSDKAQEKLRFKDEDWEIVYNEIIETLNKVMGSPDFGSYN